jgi:signal transduction histidine kinase
VRVAGAEGSVGVSVAAAAIDRPTDELRPAFCLLAAPVAAALAIAGLVRLDTRHSIDWVCAGLVVCWALAGSLVGVRQRAERIGPICLGIALLGGVALLAGAEDHTTAAGVALGVLPAAALHLLASLPDGRLRTPVRRFTVAVGYAVGGLVGAVAPHDDHGLRAWPFVLLWLAAVGVGLPLAERRYRHAGVTDRRRMQWIGWAIAVIAELVLAIVALRLLAEWPAHAAVVALATTALIPAALVAATHVRLVARVDRLLTHTVALAGLTALVIAAYVVVVVALGRGVRDSERSLLLLSMAAAALAALVYLPVRARLTNAANQLVYGEREAPDEALRTWGSRLTRAIPLDELLLQLTESLRKSMSLAAAEIFTGTDGHYDLTAGVPHRDAAPLVVGAKERAVVARAGVSGGTWRDVWLPGLAPGNSAATRVAPIAHGGELLGLIVLTRQPDGEAIGEDEDRVLTELARQVGLALHNVQLDSALQASLDELQRANAELQESRRRIVSAGDDERRRLERNLHDGAQQHLVAMAVKLRLAEDLIEDDPAEAVKVIDELRENLKEAIAELRALAHGIFPPLLMSGGLPEALPAAAARAALPAFVDTPGVGRYSAEIESTVYFCCLEAMQNAGKHAGARAELMITVGEVDDAAGGRTLTFEVTDDGVGFEPGPASAQGHGFVNMTDRLATVNGRFHVRSARRAGATIRGEIPLP